MIRNYTSLFKGSLSPVIIRVSIREGDQYFTVLKLRARRTIQMVANRVEKQFSDVRLLNEVRLLNMGLGIRMTGTRH